MRGNSNVIIVIDGVIVDDKTFQALDPSNIENINVLKGATASALYGSRGRYGAILVTTKSAKKSGFTVEFGQNTMFTAGFTNLPKHKQNTETVLTVNMNSGTVPMVVSMMEI